MNALTNDDSLVEQFICPVCFEYMDKKIFICSNGHSLCGTCNGKVSKCPCCKVKLNSKRNISLENAAKKLMEWKAKHEAIPVGNKTSKRKQRFSVGSPLVKQVEEYNFVDCQIQCPHSKCCYFTKHLLQLKIHLQSWHPQQLYAIKKDPTVKSEDIMRIRLYWDLFSVHNMFVVTISEALFIIYIIRVPNYIENSSHCINVLTVSNETQMYKFSCGTCTKFCKFYQGRQQAQDGIVVDNSILETVRRNGHFRYFAKILVTRVASLHSNDN